MDESQFSAINEHPRARQTGAAADPRHVHGAQPVRVAAGGENDADQRMANPRIS
jgi:hypothetical protein